MTDLSTSIRATLRKYRVLSHYRAARDAGAPRYAVWGPDGQVTQPASHTEANAHREDLIIAEIVGLFALPDRAARPARVARAADVDSRAAAPTDQGRN